MKQIEKLIDNQNYSLFTVNERGWTWVIIAPNMFQLDFLPHLLSDDERWEEAENYCIEPEWMPVAKGGSFNEAMEALESKLSALPSELLKKYSIREKSTDLTSWSTVVCYAFEELRNCYWINNNMHEYRHLGDTWKEAFLFWQTHHLGLYETEPDRPVLEH